MDANERELSNGKSDLFDRVVTILEDARARVARTVNHSMVAAYWLIGQEIVEEEQKGKTRAEYGKALIDNLSRRLSDCYGKGFSTTNLRYFRKFYLTYKERAPAIRHPKGGELDPVSKHHPRGGESSQMLNPDLSWSHYRALMSVENEEARRFYEIVQMYVHYFDREICTPEDGPTIGLILCTEKNDAMVEYVLDKGKERIFASRYKLELPPKDKLRKLLIEWREKEGNQDSTSCRAS